MTTTEQGQEAVPARVPNASRAQRFASFDVEAFETPGGREEDWRFTPMKRLRGLHTGAEATGSAREAIGTTAPWECGGVVLVI